VVRRVCYGPLLRSWLEFCWWCKGRGSSDGTSRGRFSLEWCLLATYNFSDIGTEFMVVAVGEVDRLKLSSAQRHL
jgi:hypothetical protein